MVNRAKQAGLTLVKPVGVTISGNGIAGTVKNQEVKIGSRAFLTEEIAMSNPSSSLHIAQTSPPLVGGVRGGGSRPVSASQHEDTALITSPGHSLVFMSVNRTLCAVFVFGDEIKQEASEVIRELKALGYQFHLVSGDGSEATKAGGQRVGIEECHGWRRHQ